MDFSEENVPILCINLRNADIAAQANSGLQKLHRCEFPDQAISDLVVLTLVIVRVQKVVTNLINFSRPGAL